MNSGAKPNVFAPEGAPGSRFAFFADPDGNGWSLQEIKRG